MTLQGVDALNPPSSAQIRAAGKSFVVRYTRNVTAAQLAADHAAGLFTVLVFESSGVDFTGGNAQGQLDAQLARQQLASVGVVNQPVYFAIDAGTTQLQDVNLYLQGCCAVLGKPNVGVYGSYSVVSAALAGSWCTWFWQTYGWSAGQINPRAHLYQYLNAQTIDGFTVDLDRTLVSDTEFGQITWTGPSQGVEMFLIKDPASALCIVFDGAYGLGLPDEATLNAFKAAGVPWLSVSQAFFNSIPMAQSGQAAALSAAQAQQLADVSAAVARIEAALKGA